MPGPVISQAATADGYTDACTAIFSFPRPGFQLQISNNAVIYQLAIPGQSGNAQDVAWDSLERSSVQALASFNDPHKEGLSGEVFAGIRVRSASAGRSAIISVS
jgi:hypothetical protein